MDWTRWEFERFGVTLTTRWGSVTESDKRNVPYQTLFSIGRLRLHCFHRGDEDPHPHDHMWDFVTFPLTPYLEKRYVGGVPEVRRVDAWRFHRRDAEFCHILLGKAAPYDYVLDLGEHVMPGKVWTIVWVGPKVREWGFWVGPEHGEERNEALNRWSYWFIPWQFVPWKDYIYQGRRGIKVRRL